MEAEGDDSPTSTSFDPRESRRVEAEEEERRRERRTGSFEDDSEGENEIDSFPAAEPIAGKADLGEEHSEDEDSDEDDSDTEDDDEDDIDN